MKNLIKIFALTMFLTPGFISAEGSKQLTPNTTGTSSDLTNNTNTRAGYLQHDDNSATMRIAYGFLKPSTWTHTANNTTESFNPDYRLYIRLKTGETLYYGVHRIATNETVTQNDLILTLRSGTGAGTIAKTTTLTRDVNSPNGSTLNTTVTTGSGKNAVTSPVAGVIATASQANIGPNLGTTATSGGYTALTFTNTGAEQDFWIEFTQTGETTMTDAQKKSWYDFWDFTVVSAGVEKPGRLFSKQWSFTAGASNNLLSSTFALFPLIPSEVDATKYYVKKFTIAGMRPFGFRFVSNKSGSAATFGTTFQDRRKSQLQRSGYMEYATFVNNPDAAIWQDASMPTFNVSSASSCNGSKGQMTFTSNSNVPTTFMVVVDLNSTAGYQAGTEDLLLEKSFPAGTNTLVWNGEDGYGIPVSSGKQIKYFYTSGAAPVNFPIFDAEGNKSGFKSENIRPATSNTTDLLYWDDTNLPLIKFPNPQQNLIGTSEPTGVHVWGATADDGNGYTVNTWTYGYTNFSQEIITFNYACNTSPDKPTTLPVTLTSFTATTNKNNIVLQWATASELNNDFFQVERSKDGVNFTAIGKVNGNGTTNLVNSYSFIDQAALNGTTYYRLKQVDLNSKFAFSTIKAVKLNTASLVSVISLYPNPANADLNINMDSLPQGSYSLKVVALTGTILKQKNVDAGQVANLDVQDLAVGSYILLVEGQAFKQTCKFLKK